MRTELTYFEIHDDILWHSLAHRRHVIYEFVMSRFTNNESFVTLRVCYRSAGDLFKSTNLFCWGNSEPVLSIRPEYYGTEHNWCRSAHFLGHHKCDTLHNNLACFRESSELTRLNWIGSFFLRSSFMMSWTVFW